MAAAAEGNAEDKLLTAITQMDSGEHSSYAVRTDGSVWAWGGGTASIGNGATTPAYTPMQLHLDHVNKVSGGYRHALFLKDDGSVWSVGGNEHGQLGNGKQTTAITTSPIAVNGLSDIIMVSAGDNHSLALRNDGTVWGFGGNEKGQLGNDSRQNALKPVKIENLPSIVSIAAGMYTSAALGNGGEIWVWGLEAYGGGGKSDVLRKPSLVKGSGEYKAIDIDQFYGTALRADGTVWMWTNQAWYQPERPMLTPFQVPGLTDIVSISMDAAVKSDGTVWTWTVDHHGIPHAVQVPGIKDAVSIASSGRNHLVRLQDGHVMSWGANQYGQTGLGVLDTEITTPQSVRKPIAVYLNDNETELTMPPLLLHNSAYVPIRGVFQQMGVEVRWDIPTRSVIAKNATSTIVLNSVTGKTTLNGSIVPASEKPVFVNDSVFVPLRLLSETLGAHVTWDAPANAVRIEQAAAN
ncbi:stalk domain-containing protein [Paenibacillus sp. BC26]|uniref:RCC1 domain-containing protein n=1 Tax=Paenibacillus sp. BC26 TaxID=1881032 RepID=UPI0015A62AE3|nr:stalk domain-containing protein [Paenibacillus sp. BC26]